MDDSIKPILEESLFFLMCEMSTFMKSDMKREVVEKERSNLEEITVCVPLDKLRSDNDKTIKGVAADIVNKLPDPVCFYEIESVFSIGDCISIGGNIGHRDGTIIATATFFETDVDFARFTVVYK